MEELTTIDRALEAAREAARAVIIDELGDEHPLTLVIAGTVDTPSSEVGTGAIGVALHNIREQDVPVIMGGIVGIVVDAARELGTDVRSFPVAPPSDN